MVEWQPWREHLRGGGVSVVRTQGTPIAPGDSGSAGSGYAMATEAARGKVLGQGWRGGRVGASVGERGLVVKRVKVQLPGRATGRAMANSARNLPPGTRFDGGARKVGAPPSPPTPCSRGGPSLSQKASWKIWKQWRRRPNERSHAPGALTPWAHRDARNLLKLSPAASRLAQETPALCRCATVEPPQRERRGRRRVFPLGSSLSGFPFGVVNR